MPVILVIVIAVVWIAILTPNVMKRRARLGDGISSISLFHRQLHVLEHSAPDPIVAPAYRLTAVGDRPIGPASEHGEPPPAPVLTVVGADQLPRPALAFLGRDAEQPEPQPERSPAPLPVATVPPLVPAVTAARTDVVARQLVRRRRRDVLGILTAVVVLTFLLGFLPGATLAWVVCALATAALGAYVALLVRLRKLADERVQKLRYLSDERAPVPAHSADRWSPMAGGRAAHPVYQVSAAR